MHYYNFNQQELTLLALVALGVSDEQITAETYRVLVERYAGMTQEQRELSDRMAREKIDLETKILGGLGGRRKETLSFGEREVQLLLASIEDARATRYIIERRLGRKLDDLAGVLRHNSTVC